VLVAAVLAGCTKDESLPLANPAGPAAWLTVHHHVDGNELLFDTIVYTNEAGEQYSTSRLEYYLSDLVLLGDGGTPNDTLHGPWYINGRVNNPIVIDRFRPGTYSGAEVLLGLPPALNLSGALPNTLENINMAWPEPMGGGYHFLKLEGHFISQGQVSGFAMHLGTNEALPRCLLPQSFSVPGASGTLDLRFNINEVFRTPHVHALDSGNYTMGSAVLMEQLRENCTDAFSISFQP
jgi:hypothetical protein